MVNLKKFDRDENGKFAKRKQTQVHKKRENETKVD